MKSVLRISFILLLSAALFGCTKTIVVTPVNPLEGTWILTDAAEADAYGWYPIVTGLESGSFSFYGNGTAQYYDGHFNMRGTWTLGTQAGGYYDEYGNYYNGVHQFMEVHLYDSYSNSSIDLYFDNVEFRGNRFAATYFNNGYISRYRFSRY